MNKYEVTFFMIVLGKSIMVICLYEIQSSFLIDYS